MFQEIPNGYSIMWKDNGSSNISNMFYGGVKFLAIYIEYFHYSSEIRIEVMATNHINEKFGCQPVLMTGSFTKELLEDFGVDIRDIPNISKDPERFLINVIRITSDLQYWSKQLNTFLNKNKKSKMDYQYPYHKEYNAKEILFFDPAVEEQKREIDRQKKIIVQLKEQIEELKEELELLRAVNQEC
jgi:hypothetical protein